MAVVFPLSAHKSGHLHTSLIRITAWIYLAWDKYKNSRLGIQNHTIYKGVINKKRLHWRVKRSPTLSPAKLVTKKKKTNQKKTPHKTFLLRQLYPSLFANLYYIRLLKSHGRVIRWQIVARQSQYYFNSIIRRLNFFTIVILIFL